MNVLLEANGKEFKRWADININLKLASVGSTFDLTLFKEVSTEELFFPNQLTECKVYIIDEESDYKELVLTGFLVSPAMSTQKVPKLSRITGYSKPGILQQNSMPQELYPLEYTDITLKEIAKKICDYYNLELYVHPGAVDKCNEKFEIMECSNMQTIYSFLRSYAALKCVTVTHDNKGRLMLLRIVDITPATSEITQDEEHMSMTCAPNGQMMHSEINVYSKDGAITDEKEGTEHDDTDTSVTTVNSVFFKPVNIKTNGITKTVKMTATYYFDNSAGIGIEDYAEYIACNEARNFPVVCSKQGWSFDDLANKGKQRVVRSGFYLLLKAPDLFIKEKTKMIVEDMVFTKSAKGPEMLEFTCLLPCVYTGRQPKSSPFKR